MRTERHNSAFTLIELLVALSIMVMILGVAYAAYAAATQSVSRCSAKIALEQEARAVLRIMAREIRCCYIRPSDVIQERGATRTLREEDRPDFLGQGDSPGGELLQFVTAGGITKLDELRAGLSVVAYRLDEANHALLRSQAKFVDTSDLFSDEKNWWLAARDVQAVELKYFDGKDWHEEWDSSDKDELPRAVSVEITFETEATGRAMFANTAWIARGNGEANKTTVRTASRNEKDGVGISKSDRR